MFKSDLTHDLKLSITNNKLGIAATIVTLIMAVWTYSAQISLAQTERKAAELEMELLKAKEGINELLLSKRGAVSIYPNIVFETYRRQSLRRNSDHNRIGALEVNDRFRGEQITYTWIEDLGYYDLRIEGEVLDGVLAGRKGNITLNLSRVVGCYSN